MPAPTLSRTYCTRRNIPLLDTSTQANITKSWSYALVLSMLGTELTGTLSGARHANSLWTHLRSSDGSSVSTNPAVNLWTGLSALVGNSTGNPHSWIVMENITSGYHCCIDLNSTLTGGFLRIVHTKIASPFSTGTTSSAPISANEWTTGVVSGGLSAGFAAVPTSVTGGSMMFHYSASQDGEFFTLMNRIGAFAFDTFFCFQKTENNNVGDTCNAFTAINSTASTPGTRGSPVAACITSPGMAGRSWNDTSVMSTGGCVSPFYGSTNWVTTVTKDGPTNEYPAFRLELGNISPVPALRGNFRDWYPIGIEISRIGQNFPTVAGSTHVVAGEFLIPFVGGSPSM